MAEARELIRTYELQSFDDDHLSTNVCLQDEREDQSHNGPLNLMQIKVTSLNFLRFFRDCLHAPFSLKCFFKETLFTKKFVSELGFCKAKELEGHIDFGSLEKLVTSNCLFILFLKSGESDIVQSLQRTDLTDGWKDEQVDDDLNIAKEVTGKEELNASMETKQRNVNLEAKLDQYDELNIDGTLDLSSSYVTDIGIPLIIQRAFQNEKKKCIRLILRDNALTSVGVKMLVDELLQIPNSLRNLGLSANPNIGDTGVEHLVRLLETNRSITLLALHNTGITDRGVRLLANVLCHVSMDSITFLEKLYISFNKSITDESVETLIQILEQNHTLKVLSLQHCSLSDRARRRLRLVTAKKKKKKFHLSD